MMREVEMTTGCVGDAETTLYRVSQTTTNPVNRVRNDMVFDDPNDMNFYIVERVSGILCCRESGVGVDVDAKLYAYYTHIHTHRF